MLTMFAIKSTRVVFSNEIKPAILLINNGVIESILDVLPTDAAYTIIDAGNKIVMPGVIDTHVHINEPGREEWEGFETATKAAIAGGVTLLVDMPLNASPVTTTVLALQQKITAATSKLYCNVGFWAGIVPGNQQHIAALATAGVLGFKAFLTHSGIDEFPNVTKADLQMAMPIIAANKLPLLVHCELVDGALITTSANKKLYKNYVATRPTKWEDDAIELMIQLCATYNCAVHIVHLSAATSINQILQAKQKGLPITVETGQHYLYFNADEIPDGNTAFKCAPPIRDKQNNDALWDALQSNIIDFVATDHSPATPNLKEVESGDFIKAWGGIASIQFALPIMCTLAKKRNATFTDILKWMCEKPAILAGVQHVKGKLAIGFDADIIIVDDEKTFTVTEQNILHKHKLTPYLHHQLCGVVTHTFLAGNLVFENGIVNEKKQGKIILKK
jgi:allantoinase